jgi:hypothetical protein
MLTFHNFASTYDGDKLPTDICDEKTGRPLLSWRVAILPWLEEDPLYHQFKLDEPWDSGHNRKLIPLMPKAYLRPGQGNAGRTHFLAISRAGVHQLMGPRPNRAGVGKKIAQIVDGVSNTIGVIDSTRTVEWTKPEDIDLARGGSPRTAMRFVNGVAVVGMLDGSIHRVKEQVSEATLIAATTIDAGDLLGPDW